MNADGEENDDEVDEEEQLVVVHLSGIIDMDYLKKCDASNCKVLGIDTDEPAVQVDRMCFHGTYNESIGTNIIFEEQCSETENGDIQKELKYLDHTTKNLDMIRVFLKNPVKDDKTNKAGRESTGITAEENLQEGSTQDATEPGPSTSAQMVE